jgi:hypothetical protein
MEGGKGRKDVRGMMVRGMMVKGMMVRGMMGFGATVLEAKQRFRLDGVSPSTAGKRGGSAGEGAGWDMRGRMCSPETGPEERGFFLTHKSI